MKISILHKFFLSFTLVLASFPLLPFGVRSVVTVIWCLSGILFYFKENKINVKLNKEIWVFLIPYLILIFSLIYSKNTNEGINTLTKMLSFIIIPIPFFLNRNIFNNKNVFRIIYVFSIAVVLLVLYQLSVVLFNMDYLLEGLSVSEIKINGYKSIHEVTEEAVSRIKLRRFRSFINTISNTHTTYQGLWISFTIFIFSASIYKRKIWAERVVLFFLVVILLTWLYLISTRMPLLSLLVSSIITIVVFGRLTKKKLFYLGFTFSLICILTLSFKNPLSIRVKEYFNTGFQVLNKSSKINDYNSSNVRNGIYYCSLNLIPKNLFLGVGIGDMQDELNNCYSTELSSVIYSWNDYNTHNQYLLFFVSSGVIGFIAFMFFLFYMIRKSYRDKNFIYFYFIISICLMFLTENILVRSDGVIFFSFFNSLLFFNTLKKKNSYDYN
ncbi:MULTISPECIES: O-antigen ligase family protein [unclassified Polaribacter]|uniref:O-antigen ligase family protein n=1 Tax=unclassified Polaribacter TaxID=196858 RepID=UPI00140947C9|nr:MULTISPECIES: O-antigen ligase family protein [unclassified Polaribacter]